MEEVKNQSHSLPSDQFIQTLKKLRRVVLVSHVSPDFDAYSSCAAMKLLLESRGAEVQIVNADGLVERYSRIPGLGAVQDTFPEDLEQWDGVIVLDCGEEKRVGDSLKGELSRAKVILNIDHHVSNPHFGTACFVDPHAASTTELVFRILKAIDMPLTKDIAAAIYLGLSADTGSFRYSSTSASVLRIAAELIEAGVSPSWVSDEMFSRNSLASVKAQALALNRVRIECDGACAIGYLESAELEKLGASSDDTEGLVERLRDIDGVQIALFLREDGEYWKGSLRSSIASVDMSQIAATLGGGGHKAASGFRTKLIREDIISHLLPLLTNALESASI